MRKITILMLALLLVLSLTSVASAAVLTFEDLDPGYEANDIIPPTPYHGFNLSAYAYMITKYYHPGSGYEYGTMGHVSMYTAWATPIAVNDGTFTFNGAYITSAWDATQTVTVNGYAGGSLIYSTDIVTHNDAAYWFDFNYAGIDSVEFINHGEHIAIDNFTYNVPEPASMFLFGSGLLSVFGLRRKFRG